MVAYKKSNNYVILLIVIQLLQGSFSEKTDELKVSEIANNLADLLKPGNLNFTTQQRFDELNNKLSNISKYVVDREEYAKLLLNETKEGNLNKTSFFESLQDESNSGGTNNRNKSLYSKMLERLNRDDIVDILTARDDKYKNMFEAARRSAPDNENVSPQHIEMKEYVSSVIRKLMSSNYTDANKNDTENRRTNYWDPKPELEELVRYHEHDDGRRFYKASEGSVLKYPFVVSIHLMGKFWCGGVLYWNDLVLTSASCLQLLHNNRLFRENPRSLAVRIASNQSLVGGETIEALEVYFHPAYNPKTLAFNVAVIRLQRHIFFGNPKVPKIIQISKNPNPPPSNVEILAMGWGATKQYAAMKYEPTFLQTQMLPVFPNYFCKKVYGDKFIRNSMFCAGTLTTGEGACDHDAGGPAVLSGRLVGIISFGPVVCGQPNSPTVFTNIGFVSSWIESIKDNMPSYYRQSTMTTTLSTTTVAVETTTAVEEAANTTETASGGADETTVAAPAEE